jgi:hypothetical protein
MRRVVELRQPGNRIRRQSGVENGIGTNEEIGQVSIHGIPTLVELVRVVCFLASRHDSLSPGLKTG